MLIEQEIINLEDKKKTLENDLVVLMTSINNTKLEKEQGEEELSVLESKKEARMVEIVELMASAENDYQTFLTVKTDEKLALTEEMNGLMTAINRAGLNVEEIKKSNLDLINGTKETAQKIKEQMDTELSQAKADIAIITVKASEIRKEIEDLETKKTELLSDISKFTQDKTDIIDANANIMEEYIQIKEQIDLAKPILESIEKKTAFIQGNYENAKNLITEIEKSTETLNTIQGAITTAKEELKTLAISKEEIDEFTRAKIQFLQDQTRLNAKEEFIIEKYNLAGLKY